MVTHSSLLAWRVPMDRGNGQATVHSVTKSQTQLKRFSMHISVTPILLIYLSPLFPIGWPEIYFICL